MNLANDLALIKHYIVHTLVDNFAVKFIAGIILSAFAEIYWAHGPVMNFIIIAFVIDLVLGLSLAMKSRSFASYRLFKGGMKFAVYGVLIYIGTGMDLISHTGDLCVNIMLASIFFRDASSIIEKLHLLGYNVPFFFVKYLDVAQQRLENQLSKMLKIDDEETPAVVPEEK